MNLNFNQPQLNMAVTPKQPNLVFNSNRQNTMTNLPNFFVMLSIVPFKSNFPKKCDDLKLVINHNYWKTLSPLRNVISFLLLSIFVKVQQQPQTQQQNNHNFSCVETK